MKTREERFEEEYKPWVLEHRKYPSLTSKYKIEKSLGRWRKDCRKKKFKPLIDFDKEVNFSSRKSPKSPEKRFEEEYKPWVLKHKKYPSLYSEDKIEKSLGAWRRDCRKKKFKPLLDFDKEVNFGFLKSPKKRFKEEYKPWVLEHKKYPSKGSDDKTERSLGNWRSKYRFNKFKPLLDFDKEVNFKSPKSSGERFIGEYIPWVLEHKKYPSPNSDDETEKSLGFWRSIYRSKIEQLKNFDIFYSNYLIGNKKAIEIFNKLKEKGII